MIFMVLTSEYHGKLAMDPHLSKNCPIVFGSNLQNKKKISHGQCPFCMQMLFQQSISPKKTAFKIPKVLEQSRSWLKFLNRKFLSDDMESMYICELRFEEKYINPKGNRVRLTIVEFSTANNISKRISKEKTFCLTS